MTYPRHRTRDLAQIRDGAKHQQRRRRERSQRVWRVVFVVIVLLAFMYVVWLSIRPADAWIAGKAEGQLEHTRWRTAIVGGFPMLDGHDLPDGAGLPNWSDPMEPVAVPDETAQKMVKLDAWLADRRLRGERDGN